MKQLQCNSCGGKYPDTRDGKAPTYFHVCPDKTENPRNENFKPHPDKPGEYVITSEGTGITETE